MSDFRQMTGWLLVAVLGLVVAGAAVLGVVQAPTTVGLQKAVSNTLSARNYSEVLTQSTPQGTESDYLVYQAPDRLGGYVQSGNKRTYVVVIGKTEYQSLTVAANASTKHLIFYRQQTQGAKALDPVHGYLPYAKQAHNVKQAGSTYSFELTKAGQVGRFTFIVSGPNVSQMRLSVKNASIKLTISQVGSSPPVALPPGAKVMSPKGAGSGASPGS